MVGRRHARLVGERAPGRGWSGSDGYAAMTARSGGSDPPICVLSVIDVRLSRQVLGWD